MLLVPKKKSGDNQAFSEIIKLQFEKEHHTLLCILRTVARNIDFFLQILPLKDDELVMSEMYKKWGVTDFVLERTCPEEHPKSEKIRLL